MESSKYPSVLGCSITHVQGNTYTFHFTEPIRPGLKMDTTLGDGSVTTTNVDMSGLSSVIAGTTDGGACYFTEFNESQIEQLPVGGMAFIVKNCSQGLEH